MGPSARDPIRLKPEATYVYEGTSVGRRRRRLEHEVDLFGFLLAERHFLVLRSEPLVPRLDCVAARRERLERELAVLVGDGKERGIEDADVGVRPAVDVALDRDHDF